MILIDTHIWVWWVNSSPDLFPRKTQILASRQADGIGVSTNSCWEVAKLVEKGRLALGEALPQPEVFNPPPLE